MITVSKPSENRRDAELLVYPSLFDATSVYTEEGVVLALSVLTGRLYSSVKTDGSIACIFTEEDVISSQRFPKGTVAIIGELFRKTHSCRLPKQSLVLYERDYLPHLYRTTKERTRYRQTICKRLAALKAEPQWKQNPEPLFSPLVPIGKGNYGNVFKITSPAFALKMAKLKPDAVKEPFSTSHSSWHEWFFLQKLFTPLVEKGVCPNLPVLYDSFTYDTCRLTIDDQEITTHGLLLAVELADGTLKDYLQEKRSVSDLHSALFQIMAALYTIQHRFQLMNFDVKKENILYYSVEPGGYWVYVIRGQRYYVPNRGYLFVLNDFGISRTMSPRYKSLRKIPNEDQFRLGSRHAYVKDGRFQPFSFGDQKVTWREDGTTTRGAEFKVNHATREVSPAISLSKEERSYLLSQGVKKEQFFSSPDIIPPFEFYNDTQDAIRMFTGGKRTTQKGNHRRYATVSKKFTKQLEGYVGKGESAKSLVFSQRPEETMACYFLSDFFTRYSDYLLPKTPVIETYEITTTTI